MANAQLMSVGNIATMFGVSRFGLYKKIRAGQIPAYHFGRKVLLDPAELREVLRRPLTATSPSASSPPSRTGSPTRREGWDEQPTVSVFPRGA